MPEAKITKREIIKQLSESPSYRDKFLQLHWFKYKLGDWHRQLSGMPLEAKGGYLLLFMYLFENGVVTTEEAAEISGLRGKKLDRLLMRFDLVENDLYTLAAANTAYIECAASSMILSMNGRKGGRPRIEETPVIREVKT